MKLDKETLKRIIKEELESVLDESQLLDRYSKDKEEEFRQYLRDMGKDPDEIIDTLGPEHSRTHQRVDPASSSVYRAHTCEPPRLALSVLQLATSDSLLLRQLPPHRFPD